MVPESFTFSRRAKVPIRDMLAQAFLPIAKLDNRLGPRVPVLLYHRVLPNFPDGSPLTGNVHPSEFEAQMSYLARKGYASLSLEDYRRIAGGEAPVPPKAVLLTFDDGYADNYHVALGIARKYSITLNIFISAGIIGLHTWPYSGRRTLQERSHMAKYPELWRPLTWPEVREMKESGVCFGCHGYLHRKLSSLSPDELTQEVALDISSFENYLGYHPISFAIPWGDSDSYTLAVLETLKAHGFELVFTTRPERTRLPAKGFVFSRIAIRDHDDLDAFCRKLQGAHEWLRRISSYFITLKDT